MEHLEPVAETLEAEGVRSLRQEAPPEDLTPRRRRQEIVRQTRNRSRAAKKLERMEVKGIDTKRDIRQQSFSEITWSKGKPAAEVFDALNREQKGG
mgnify:CR=1 FL=1